MSKKLYQQLFEQNSVTVDELKEVTDQMEALQHTGRFAEWDQLNRRRAALIDDLCAELTAAYYNQPVTAVRLQGYNKFWDLVNGRLMEGEK